MKILIPLLAILFISCKQEEPKGITLTKEMKDSAMAAGKKFLEQWYDDSTKKITVDYALPASMKRFLIFPKRTCRENIEYKLDQLREMASDTNSLINVSARISTYNIFLKKEDISFNDVYMDTLFRVLLIHCDSGIVYRKIDFTLFKDTIKPLSPVLSYPLP